jgi:predicted nucleotidyltransferase
MSRPAHGTRDLSSDLQWLVERIRDGYEPEKIILFGSLARGETHEWSDIDLIVVKDTNARYGERVRELLPVLRGWKGGADILIYSLDEYEAAKRKGSAFLGEAEKDGVTLYER